jgi:hypothetical protein
MYHIPLIRNQCSIFAETTEAMVLVEQRNVFRCIVDQSTIVRAIATDIRDKWIVTASYSKSRVQYDEYYSELLVWKTQKDKTGSHLMRYVDGIITALMFCPHGDLLAVGDDKSNVMIRQVGTPDWPIVHSIRGMGIIQEISQLLWLHQGDITEIKSKLIICVGNKGDVQAIDNDSGNCFPHPAMKAMTLAFSTQFSTLYGAFASSIDKFDITSMSSSTQCMVNHNAHDGHFITSLSTVENMLASAGRDCSVRLWWLPDVVPMKQLQHFNINDQPIPVDLVCFHPSGNYLFSSNNNTTTKSSSEEDVERAVMWERDAASTISSATLPYGVGIGKVFRQIYPDMEIPECTLASMNSYVCDLELRLVREANGLRNGGDSASSLTIDHIQSAVETVMNGQLPKYVAQENVNAMTKLRSIRAPYPDLMNTPNEQENDDGTVLAGLVLSNTRVVLERIRQWYVYNKVSEEAIIYLITALEYVVAEVLELAGKRTEYVELCPFDLYQAIHHDEELLILFKSML